jgi:pimeloyl-ACP methyl ester carboxylesterase
LVLLDAVPLLPGYRWHTLARQWRRALVGELAMGFTTKFAVRRLLRLPDGRPFPEDEIDEIWRHFDHGTQRAILKLYRSAPPAVLAAAGQALGAITAPALIVWGERDPYIPTSFARGLAEALGTPDPEMLIVPGAGHWTAMDDPDTAARILRFVAPKPG